MDATNEKQILVKCRSCEGPMQSVLDLGKQPFANAFLDVDNQAENPQPLELCRCEACGLLQLRNHAPPDWLFNEYLYFTSASAPMVEHARAAAERYIDLYKLGPDKRVLEIASNDGYFLKHFTRCGAQLLGIEPAMNVAMHAITDGIPTLVQYFSHQFAKDLSARGWKADLLLANNVLAHVPDINDFMAGVRTMLAKDGVAIFEFPYALQMLERNEFDTIYHEHVFYFTLTALEPIFERAGLEPFHVEHLTVHGGAIRIFVRHGKNGPKDNSLIRAIGDEIHFLPTWDSKLVRFAAEAERIRDTLRKTLADFKAMGRRIAAYGASAKGNVLLNYCGIGRETIDFITDTTPAKQGKYAPGSRIPVAPPGELLKQQPDYCLLLIWNFQDQVLKQESEYLARGGRFIVAIPEVRVI